MQMTTADISYTLSFLELENHSVHIIIIRCRSCFPADRVFMYGMWTEKNIMIF